MYLLTNYGHIDGKYSWAGGEPKGLYEVADRSTSGEKKMGVHRSRAAASGRINYSTLRHESEHKSEPAGVPFTNSIKPGIPCGFPGRKPAVNCMADPYDQVGAVNPIDGRLLVVLVEPRRIATLTNRSRHLFLAHGKR